MIGSEGGERISARPGKRKCSEGKEMENCRWPESGSRYVQDSKASLSLGESPGSSSSRHIAKAL